MTNRRFAGLFSLWLILLFGSIIAGGIMSGLGCNGPQAPDWRDAAKAAIGAEVTAVSFAWTAVELQMAAKPGSIPPKVYSQAKSDYLRHGILASMAQQAVENGNQVVYLSMQVQMAQVAARIVRVKGEYCPRRE